jgi:polyketide synthase-associated protein
MAGPAQNAGLVEIQGLDAPIVPVNEAALPDSDSPSFDANGCIGRVVQLDVQTGKCTVHLSNDQFVQVGEANLRSFSPASYRDGAIDLMWPSTPDDFGPFAFQVSDYLAQQGWCLVECISRQQLRDDAWSQAQELSGYFGPKPEVLVDYLGKGGSGKVAYLEAPSENAVADAPYPDALHRLDDELEFLSQALANMASENMGFNCAGRRKTLVSVPFANREETMRLRGEPITEEEVEDGLVERHLTFIRQRKVGIMRMVENEGGEISLIPREDISDLKPVKLPISPNKLLIYRADYMTYSYKPRPLTKSLVLQTWLLEETPRVTMRSLLGGMNENKEIIGIRGESLPPPEGDRIHCMAMSGRHAGEATYSAQSWCVFSTGCDAFIHIPTNRFDCDIYCSQLGGEKIPGLSYVRHSSMLPEDLIFNFDHEFFALPEQEVKLMSPSHRTLLEEGYSCIYQYGYTRESVRGRNLPVYIGDTGSDWSPMNAMYEPEFIAQGKHMGVDNLIGASVAMTAGRLSCCLGLRGPTSAIDTACSASLVAVQVAAHNLRKVTKDQGRVHMGTQPTEALPGGVSVQVGPFSFIALCGGTMLSPKGRCHTYNDTADGYARGEGAVFCFLTISDNDVDVQTQLACIMGISANQDGRSANLTAPNGPAQQACIRDSMHEAGMTAREICVAECHGTGTALGDPIEVGALRGAMEPRTNPIGETSAKSNIGHLEACAGITGLQKCVMMMNSSIGTPNVHLALLNANLDMTGFPVYFETEFFDTNVDAGVSGVSSFGFGGTNARADVWSRCRRGYRKTGEERIDKEAIRHIQVQCPITLGPIDYLTGEPIKEVMLSGKHKRADVIRDVLAPYDTSRYAYGGGFRYRLCEPMDAYEEDLPEKTRVKVCGSWCGWRSWQSLERKGEGLYSIEVVLGETRCEKFYLSLNGDMHQLIYPQSKNASQLIHICGPDHRMRGRYWSLDGRDEEVPAGTVYRINFKWGVLSKAIWWEKVSPELAPLVDPIEHMYCLVGTCTSWKPQDMVPSQHEEGTWETQIRIGGFGREEFRFMRDSDEGQTIYPAREKTSVMGVPLQGPDDYCMNRSWVVRGDTGDTVRLRLRVVDGDISVEVSGDCIRPKIWENLMGWDRHQYYAVGSWNSYEPLPMVMDADNPGTFRCRVTFDGDPQSYSSLNQCFEYQFQINVDGVPQLAYFPDCDEGGNAFLAGKYITAGPLPNDAEEESTGSLPSQRWSIRSRQAGSVFEIAFTPNSPDRRRVVTWFFVGWQSSLALEG